MAAVPERITAGSLRSIRYYTPLGTAADTTNLQALGDSLAALTATNGGGELRIRSGTALLTSAGGPALNIAGWSALIINAHPNLRLLSSVAAGGFNGFAMKAFPTTTAYGAGSTLTVAAVVGAMSVTVSVAPAIGDKVRIAGDVAVATDKFMAARYIVRNVVGLVVTLDRPVRIPFIVGATMTKITKSLENFSFEGNGCRFDGTGDRLFEALPAYRSWLRNIRFGPNDAGAIATDIASWDIGSLQCGYEGCDADGVTIASGGLMFECNERPVALRCNPKRCGDNFRLWDNIDTTLIACNPAEAVNANILLDSNQMAHGCFQTRIKGGTSTKSANIGVGLVAATDTIIVGHRSTDAPLGFEIGGGVVGSIGATLVRCSTARNATFGTHCSTASGTKLVSHSDEGGTVASPTAEALRVDAGDVDVDVMNATGAIGSVVARCAGGSLRLRGVRLLSTGQGNTVYMTAGTVIIDSGEFTAPTTGLNCAGGTMRVGGTSFAGGPALGAYNSGGTMLFTGGNDLSLAATPTRNDNGEANVSHDENLRFAAVGVIGVGATFLGEGNMIAVQNSVRVRIKRKTVFRDIQIELSVASGANTCLFTVNKNAVATTLTITPGAAALTASLDAAGPNAQNVVFLPGDYLSIAMVAVAGCVAADPRVTIVGVGA